MKSKEAVSVEIALNMWNLRVKQMDKLLESLSDERLLQDIAPGKNRGIYILGHITWLHDQVFLLLGLGERLYPEWDQIFGVTVPDKTVKELPDIKEVRDSFKNITEALTSHFNKLKVDEWFERHNSVSPEDFEKEPYRNKLSILVTRTNHFSHHGGQLALLK